MILVAIVASVLGLLLEVGGIKTIRRADYQRCLRNIARLEIATGIVPAPIVERRSSTAEVQRRHALVVNKWQRSLAEAQAKYTTAQIAGRTKSGREHVGHIGPGVTPSELAKIRAAKYARWCARQRP